VGQAEFERFDGVVEPFEGPIRFPPVPEEIDPHWTCRSWEEATGESERSPFVVRILTDPVVAELEGYQDARAFRVERSRRYDLVDLPYTGGLVRVVREPRRASTLGAARALAGTTGGGIRIWQSPGNAGTAGGVIEVAGHGECTTTAGHVAPRIQGPVFADFGGGDSIGECIDAPDYHSPGLIDETSLVEIAGHPWRRSGHGVVKLSTDDLKEGRRLTVLGARTSHPDVFPVDYVQHRYLRSGTATVRIDDGFELRRHSDGFFGLGAGFRRPTLPGDSGAWVFRLDGDEAVWVGSVVGGDDISTVATFSVNTIAELTRKFGSATLKSA
jgi:hypothetical protein